MEASLEDFQVDEIGRAQQRQVNVDHQFLWPGIVNLAWRESMILQTDKFLHALEGTSRCSW